jgi:hypothetical protein
MFNSLFSCLGLGIGTEPKKEFEIRFNGNPFPQKFLDEDQAKSAFRSTYLREPQPNFLDPIGTPKVWK